MGILELDINDLPIRPLIRFWIACTALPNPPDDSSITNIIYDLDSKTIYLPALNQQESIHLIQMMHMLETKAKGATFSIVISDTTDTVDIPAVPVNMDDKSVYFRKEFHQISNYLATKSYISCILLVTNLISYAKSVTDVKTNLILMGQQLPFMFVESYTREYYQSL